MDTNRSVRIGHFQTTGFSSNRTRFSQLQIHSLRGFLPAVLLLSAAIPTLAHAQTVFHFSEEVHWGNAVLPPGDYVITSLDVRSARATPGGIASDHDSGSSPASEIDHQESASRKSIPANGRLFPVRNPRNQAMPYAQAETIYLSACRVVEQEFHRAESLRPRLTLVLGANRDALYYPNREIQLRKWDGYRFAQGVVLLAVDDMLPRDKQILLTKLAVLEAESTVDVRELKDGRGLLNAGPRN